METRVSFYSDGYKLAGILFTPDDLPQGEKRSGVVFCEGFAGSIKHTPVVAFCRCLSENGYVALLFDYRGFGGSEGPKWRLIPLEEVEDVRNGITFLQQQRQVDAASIGVYGVSYGGAIGIYAAAMDKRVRCVVVHATVGNGGKWLRSLRNNSEWMSFVREVEEDRVQSVLTGTSRMVDRQQILVPDAESQVFSAERLKQNPDACTHLPLETARAVIEFSPEEVVHKIAPRPLLFVVAENDVIAPVEFAREMYDNAGEPKKFVTLHGCAHYATYSPPHLKLAVDEGLAWFQRFMPPVNDSGELLVESNGVSP